MNDNKAFIGMGHNPNPRVHDIPVGFGMELMMNADARSAFEKLGDEQKNRLISYIQGGVTGDDAKHRVLTAVDSLAKGTVSNLI